MLSKQQLKQRHCHDLKKAKQSRADAQFMAAISRGEVKIGRGGSVPHLKTPMQKLTYFMTLSATAIALVAECEARQAEKNNGETCANDSGSNSQCRNSVDSGSTNKANLSPTIKLNGTTPEQCAYINRAVANVKSNLPDSSTLINRVIAMNDFALTCEKSGTLPGNAVATFDPVDNAIHYPEKKPTSSTNAAVEQFDETSLHHEFIHADTSRRHKTNYCQPALFSRAENNILRREMGLIYLPDELKAVMTAAPIWPPVMENLNRYRKLIEEDLTSGATQHLITLHNKIIKQHSLSASEQHDYERYIELLNGCLFPQVYYPVNGYPISQINDIRRGKRAMPEALLIDGNAILTDFMLQKLDDGSYALQGKIQDSVSAYLHRINHAQVVFKRYMAMNTPYNAYAELDTYLRTGMSEKALIEFLPNLYANLKRDEDCCDKGIVSRCNKI